MITPTNENSKREPAIPSCCVLDSPKPYKAICGNRDASFLLCEPIIFYNHNIIYERLQAHRIRGKRGLEKGYKRQCYYSTVYRVGQNKYQMEKLTNNTICYIIIVIEQNKSPIEAVNFDRATQRVTTTQ